MKKSKIYQILALLLVMQWAFLKIISQFPNSIENYYSNGFYQWASKVSRILLNWIPFSIGDLLYALIIFYVIRNLIKVIKQKKLKIAPTLIKITGIFSVIFFLFHLLWGINYYRQPVATSLHIKNGTYKQKDLIDFTKKIIDNLNTTQEKITLNDSAIVRVPYTRKEMFPISVESYNELALVHPQYKYNHASHKFSLFSLPLTYMGFSGYLNPLTNEAHINKLAPKTSFPAIICHEMAHQLGIASENEANFIGFLATVRSDDLYFQYSGYLMALSYCLYDIRNNDEEVFDALIKEINHGVLLNIAENRKFWQSYRNPFEKYFKGFYNLFLKANKQKEGIKSYNQVVSLLVNYHMLNALEH